MATATGGSVEPPPGPAGGYAPHQSPHMPPMPPAPQGYGQQPPAAPNEAAPAGMGGDNRYGNQVSF